MVASYRAYADPFSQARRRGLKSHQSISILRFIHCKLYLPGPEVYGYPSFIHLTALEDFCGHSNEQSSIMGDGWSVCEALL
tara:strand:- start:1302 stop:1544 length:243 start_codon:yes stop_codon:yes gene_type:complete